ncbi:mCG1026837, partial [Mus musculus]
HEIKFSFEIFIDHTLIHTGKLKNPLSCIIQYIFCFCMLYTTTVKTDGDLVFSRLWSSKFAGKILQ